MEQGQCGKSKSLLEEKILVTVRLRPLTDKEVSSNDFYAWKCVNDKTVAHHVAYNTTCFPQFYVYDQVFDLQASTNEVYEKGAKEVALSALMGKNATVFAYGQTSSGKTYTMRGITENAADDIFRYVDEHSDRIFVIKFSALEIYNEVVNDLLNPESNPLRLLDDPEKGTVVEGLTEKIVQDKDHLHNLLAFCETHRQVGETAMNDISSRSHQIIRMTIESHPQVMMDERPAKSLIAYLNFIDLAGSERASLSQSDGTRLKEGCYINRSLLTLSTVIRKLSESNRAKSGHIPFRDSKLTRILQNSLGGNARTAVICTVSPSNRHIEQTRNTLFFASCAKEVTNRAQVNMVISEKDLIKQLKKEVALLESKLELSTFPVQSFPDELVLEKEIQIQKMQDEMRKIMQQRDFVQSQLNTVLKQMEAMEEERQLVLSKIDAVDTSLLSPAEEYYYHINSTHESFEQDMFQSENHEYTVDVNEEKILNQTFDNSTIQVSEKQSKSASDILLKEIYRLENLQTELAQDANQALEAVEKNVECLCLSQLNKNQEAADNVALLQAEIHGIYESRAAGSMSKTYSITKDVTIKESKTNAFVKDAMQMVEVHHKDIPLKEAAIEVDANVIDISLENKTQRVETNGKESKREDAFVDCDDVEKVLVNNEDNVVKKRSVLILPALGKCEVENEATRFNIVRNSVDENQEAHQVFVKDNLVIGKDAPPEAEESVVNVHAYVTNLKERVAELQHQKEVLTSRVSDLENGASNGLPSDSSLILSVQSWNSEFHMKQKQIFELWDICHISIVYRSQFYHLFRGDPGDAIYVEVELRRLTWLRTHNSTLGFKGSILSREEHGASPGLRARTLKRERESLVKFLKSSFTSAERDEVYKQWGIPLESKQRKLKLVYLMWTNPNDEEHIKMSADLVAKLLKLWDRTGKVSKEMFLLSFSPLNENPRISTSSISSFFSF